MYVIIHTPTQCSHQLLTRKSFNLGIFDRCHSMGWGEEIGSEGIPPPQMSCIRLYA